MRRAATALKASEALHAAYGEAQRTFEMLAGCAENIQLKPIAAGSPLSHAGLIWDAVCLLAASRVTAFRQQVQALGGDLRGRGMRLRVSGPWPPYHFTEMGQDDVASS